MKWFFLLMSLCMAAELLAQRTYYDKNGFTVESGKRYAFYCEGIPCGWFLV